MLPKSELIQKSVDYILKLPDECSTTMYEVVMGACPGAEVELDIGWFHYGVLEEIVDAAEKKDLILDFSPSEGIIGGLPYREKFIIRKKRLKKAQIISNLLCFGPCPEPEDPVEQRLTISCNGRVWFTEYVFGGIKEHKHPIGRRLQLSIGKVYARAILSYLADFCESESLIAKITDIGEWRLTVTMPDEGKKQLSGSLNGGVFVGNVNLTDYIRQIPIERLAVFGE